MEMSQPLAAFPESEHRERLSRAREKIREADLAGCICVAPENIYYLMIYNGTELLGINCRAESMRSIDDIVKEIAEKAASSPSGHWLRGYGYDDAVLEEGRHPRCEDLDPVSPPKPGDSVPNLWSHAGC